MIDKIFEGKCAEHYFAWADKEGIIFNHYKSHFPRVYVAFKPTDIMCKFHNVCSPLSIAVHPYAAPAFQMAFSDLHESIDAMRKPNGSQFILRGGDLVSPPTQLQCLSDSSSGDFIGIKHAMSSNKSQCLKEIALGVFKRSCYEAGDHGNKCAHGIDYNSYGIGLYVKEGENISVGLDEAKGLDKTGDLHQIPMEFIGTMKRYGFEWGGEIFSGNVNIQPARFTLRSSPRSIWSAASSGAYLDEWGVNRNMTKKATEIMQYCAKRFANKDASAIFR